MKKSGLGKKTISVVLSMLMVLSLVPTAAIGAAADVIVSEVEVGSFTVCATDGAELSSSDYSYENGVLTVKSSTPITIRNTDSSTATTDRIYVDNGIDAYITLAGVNLQTASDAAGAPF